MICDLAWNSIDDEGVTVVQSIFGDITQQKEEKNALKQAKEMAESSAKVTQRFLANMSHEIRTPLNGVMGLANLLKGTSLDEHQLEY